MYHFISNTFQFSATFMKWMQTAFLCSKLTVQIANLRIALPQIPAVSVKQKLHEKTPGTV
jgi:hypothetical protein